VREYTSWLRWWQSAVHPDDFLQFLADRETDFLSVIFHLYPDTEPDDRALADERVRAHAAALARAARERGAAKGAWAAGQWNTQSVELGGLGWTGPDGSQDAIAEAHARLADAAARLRLSPAARMDLTIKYSSSTAAPVIAGPLEAQVALPAPLALAAELWTLAADAVLAREAVLARLEALERLASDPSRLLAKVRLCVCVCVRVCARSCVCCSCCFCCCLCVCVCCFARSGSTLITATGPVCRVAPCRGASPCAPGPRPAHRHGCSRRGRRRRACSPWRCRELCGPAVPVRSTAVCCLGLVLHGVLLHRSGFVCSPRLSEKMATDRREMLYWLQQERRQARLPATAMTTALLSPSPAPSAAPPAVLAD
jgi:hypothetical protein